MSDNLNASLTGFYRLPNVAVASLTGPDAVAFAQAQFANDLRTLADGQWQWNAWLTAKGRVISVFQVLRVSEQQLLAVFHDDDAQPVIEALRRFVFRRKVVLAVETAAVVTGALQAPPAASGNSIATAQASDMELDVGAPGLPRTLRIHLNGQPETGDSLDFALLWRQSDLQLGLPRLEASQREQWTPQQLGLDRLNAVSVKKGCYPGQEIVARTHFLGKAKRSLALLAADQPLATGANVQAEGATIGTAACTAGALALAVLPLDVPETTLSIDGAAVQIQAIIDGLQR